MILSAPEFTPEYTPELPTESPPVAILGVSTAVSPVTSIPSQLESQARVVVAKTSHTFAHGWEWTPVSTVERELALTIEELDRFRKTTQYLRDDLLRTECELDTQILALHPWGVDRISPHNPVFHQLQDRLRKLHEERRRLALTEIDRLRLINERLLKLLGRHAVLSL